MDKKIEIVDNKDGTITIVETITSKKIVDSASYKNQLQQEKTALAQQSIEIDNLSAKIK